MTDPNDPLAALSAAAQNRSTVKPRSKPAPRPVPVAKKAQQVAAKPTGMKFKGAKQSHTLLYLAIAAMALVVVAGVILVVVVANSKNETTASAKKQESNRPVSDTGPGSLFSNVKAQDPGK